MSLLNLLVLGTNFDPYCQNHNIMITETEVQELLITDIPTLLPDIIVISKPKEFFRVIKCFAEHTKELITEHQTADVIQCFDTASKLLNQGCETVKFAVVNLYIEPVSRLLERSFSPEPAVRAEFIKDFGKEYYRLLYSHNP